MKKKWYQSKTILGFGLFLAVSYLAKEGIWSNDTLTPLLELAGSLMGLYGARDAVTQK